MQSDNQIRDHRDLIAWQKAMNLVTSVYKASRVFPKEEAYGLTSQLRRAAVSVPANIAEGQGRRSKPEFRQFLGHARGSLLELDTHSEIALRLEYINRQQHAQLQEQLSEVGRIINGLLRSLTSDL
ncbi:MAG TPA: four helix bundle protein [Pyrinomonadaceae bacterium]|jgi:four helix bundle protein